MESDLTLEVIIGRQEEYPVDPVCILYNQLYFMVDVLVDVLVDDLVYSIRRPSYLIDLIIGYLKLALKR